MTGKQSDIGDQSGSIFGNHILLEYDHRFLRIGVSFRCSLDLVAYLCVGYRFCKFVKTFDIRSFSHIDERLCHSFKEGGAVIGIDYLFREVEGSLRFRSIHHDNFSSGLCSLSQLVPDYRVSVLEETEDENHFCGKKFVDGIRRSIASQYVRQRIMSRIEAEGLCADSLSELLHRIGFFIGISVGNGHGNRVASVSYFYCFQFLCRHDESFVIVSSAEIVSVFNQRIYFLALKNGSVKSPLTFSAADSCVYIAFLIRVGLDQHVAVGFQFQTASYRAVCAGCFRNFSFQRNFLLNGQSFLKSADRAYTYALSAAFASGFS